VGLDVKLWRTPGLLKILLYISPIIELEVHLNIWHTVRLFTWTIQPSLTRAAKVCAVDALLPESTQRLRVDWHVIAVQGMTCVLKEKEKKMIERQREMTEGL